MNTGDKRPMTDTERAAAAIAASQGQEGPALPADVVGVLQDFLPHVQEVAGAAIDWQVEKFLEVRTLLHEKGIPLDQATQAALEIVKTGMGHKIPNALPWGAGRV